MGVLSGAVREKPYGGQYVQCIIMMYVLFVCSADVEVTDGNAAFARGCCCWGVVESAGTGQGWNFKQPIKSSSPFVGFFATYACVAKE